MEMKKPKEASPVVADSVDTNETGPTRRELLVRGSKVAAGIGVAALLGNVGTFPRGSYGMGQPTMSLLDSLTPAKTALLVIDMQRDFLLPEGYAAQAGLDIYAFGRDYPSNRKAALHGASSRTAYCAYP